VSTTASTRAARAPLSRNVELLRRRAAALARVPRREVSTSTVNAVLFKLGQEQYAIEAARVLEVAALRDLTPLPGAPPPLLGLTHWRGEVLTVLDLRAVLGVRTQGLTDLRRLIVVAGRRRAFGILADQAREIIAIDTSLLQRARDRDEQTDLIAGMTDDAVLMIDADALARLHGGGTNSNRG
jgi:purine-binding chemotaxis protein CheW